MAPQEEGFLPTLHFVEVSILFSLLLLNIRLQGRKWRSICVYDKQHLYDSRLSGRCTHSEVAFRA